MPILGLGTWKSDPGEVYRAVREAINMGYRHLDCAPVYMNEREIGQALSDAFKAGDVTREELWITSKLWCNSHGTEHVRPALQKTLKDLQLDYLDLYLIHWPMVFKNDILFPESGDDFICLDEVPLSLTWRAMEQCVKEGLSRHIGVSNFSVKKLEELKQQASFVPEVNQIELHPFLQQKDMLAYCKTNGIHLTAYSPLGSMDREAFLKSENEPVLLEHPIIAEIAFKHDCTPAQVLIAWSIAREVSVIPKSTNKERLLENLQAANITLDEKDMNQISKMDRHFRYVDGTFFAFGDSSYDLESLWDE